VPDAQNFGIRDTDFAICVKRRVNIYKGLRVHRGNLHFIMSYHAASTSGVGGPFHGDLYQTEYLNRTSLKEFSSIASRMGASSC
jgi:hypothetical protein